MFDVSEIYHGVDTVRFVATTGFINVVNPITREVEPTIYLDGFPLTYRRMFGDFPVFEVSAYVWFGRPPGYLAGFHWLIELIDQFCGSGIEYESPFQMFRRIDFAAHIPWNITMESLSYLRFYGRRSLQKKSEPWAFWPGPKKTLKFYNKVKESVYRKTDLYGPAEEVPLRFEIESRGWQTIRKFLDGYSGFNYSEWNRNLSHFTAQITTSEVQISSLSDLDCRILLAHMTGQLDSSTLTHRGKKSLQKLDAMGVLNACR